MLKGFNKEVQVTSIVVPDSPYLKVLRLNWVVIPHLS